MMSAFMLKQQQQPSARARARQANAKHVKNQCGVVPLQNQCKNATLRVFTAQCALTSEVCKLVD